MSENLRPMQPQDYDALQHLWAPEGMDYMTRAGFERLIWRNPTSCLVIERAGMLLAGACGAYDGRRAIVQSVAVHPAERGHGYGQRIVRAVVDALWQLDPEAKIRLFVLKEKPELLAFYTRLGFEVRDDLIYMALTHPNRV
ncbi:MAG: GNAT family N-acetyltransferase [Anaerolineales bacterium]